MNNILIVTHSTLAEGFYNSTKFLSGKTDDLTFINAYVDDSDWTKKVEKWLSNQNEVSNAVVMTDLYGGSVNQKMTLLLKEYHFTLITGINLPIVLSMVLEPGELTSTRIIELVKEAKSSLQIVKEPEKAETSNDDDFLS